MGVIIRQSIKGSIVNYIGAFIGFLTIMVIALEFLEAEEIGLTKVLLEAATLIATFAQLGITSSAIRYFPYFKSKDNRHNGFFFYLVVLPAIGCVIFALLFICLKQPISDYFGRNSELFVNYADWVIPLMLFLVYIGVFETYSNVLMRIVIPKVIREIVIRLLIVVIYVLYGLRYIGLTEFVAAYVGVYGIAMLLNLWYVSRIGSVSLKHNNSFVSPPLRKDICKYTGISTLGVLSGSITAHLDLFMVSAGMGLNYGGIYVVASYMATVIDIPSRSITAISSPVASEAMQAGDIVKANDLYRRVSLNQLLIGGFIFLLIWINIDLIFDIIPNGEEYRAGKWVVFYIGISRLIVSFLSFGNILIRFSKYYYWTLYFTLIITILSILMNLWLIPKFGMTGAAVATLLTTALTYFAQQWIVFRKIKANPYTWNTFKLILILFSLLGVNYLLPELGNSYITGIYRSIVVMSVGLFAVLRFQISADVNALFLKVIEKIRNR